MFARSIRRAAYVLFVALAVLAGRSNDAHAQVGTGALVGTVKDAATQKAVADVVVTVTSPALQGEEVAVTGANGDFRISGLPPGEYTIRMDKESYRPYSRAGVRIRTDVTLRVDTQLLPEGLKTDIVVIARAPTVDVGSTQTGATIDKEFVRRVPNIRPGGKGSDTRSIEAAAPAAPQAKSDDYGTSIAGTTSPENNYVIDGLGVGDPAYGTLGTPMSIEFIDELNIITGGYMPEYGKATGGILNAVSKSGSDMFELNIWGFYAPGGLTGKSERIIRQGDTIDTQAEVGDIYDFGFSIGGPLIKEKLWFFVGADFASVTWNLKRSFRRIVYDANFNPVVDPDTDITETELIPGTTKDFVAETQTLQVFGKFTYRLNKNNRFSLTLLGSPRWSGGDGKYGMDSRDGQPEVTALVGEYTALGHQFDGGSFDAMFKWNSDLINDKLLLETSIGWHHQNDGRFPSDGSEIGSKNGLAGTPMVNYRRSPINHDIRDFEPNFTNSALCDAPIGAPEGTLPCPVQSYLLGGPDYLSDETLSRIGARSVLSWLPEGAGTHVIKLGADFDYMTYNIKKAYSGGIRYRESLGGGSFTDIRGFGFLQGPDDEVPLASVQADVNSASLGIFLQDSWTLTRGLTLNLGVRWDAQWIQNDAGETIIALANQWSPRVGFVWDPTTDGGAKIYANLALFYESVPLDVADRAGSGEPQILSVKSASGCDPTDPAQTGEGGACLDDANRNVINGPSSPDRLWLINGGGRTPVDPDLEAQSSWEFVAGAEYDLGRIDDLMKNLRAGVLYTKRWMNNVIEDMSRDEAQTYFIGNPGSGIAKDFPEAERNYDALTVYFMKEFSECWLLQGSYTLSWLEGNYAGLFRPETQQLDPNINSDFDLKSLTVNRYGPLPGDNRHQFKVFGAHDIELAKGHHLQPGYGFRLSSGGPTNFLASHPVYGSDEVFLLPRGSGERLPWVASIDLSVGYELEVTESFKLGFTVEIFNLFNFQATTATSQRYTNADANPLINGSKADLNNALDLDGESIAVNPNFGNTTSYQRPRTFRFGIRGTL